MIAKLAINLLGEETNPKILAFVAEAEDRLLGHVAFSPVTLDGHSHSHSNSHSHSRGYILAPLAVTPDDQKQGIGSQLVQHGIQHLAQMGVDLLLVYGDPKYYSRFGFREETAKPYLPPYELQYPFGWQGLMLSDRPLAQSPVQVNCVGALQDPALW